MKKLTAAQEKRIETLSKVIRSSLDEVLKIAKSAGCRNPRFFVECEGPTFHVMDADHPGHRNCDTASAYDRQKAILFSLPDDMPPYSDVGAW